MKSLYMRFAACIVATLVYCSIQPIFMPIVATPEQVWDLFTTTPEALHKQTQDAIDQANRAIEAILAISKHDRTFDNTCRALDSLTYGSSLLLIFNMTRVLLNTHPSEALRAAAQENKTCVERYLIDIWSDARLYQALVDYYSRHDAALLSAEEQYYLQKTLHKFKTAGAHLPETERMHVHNLLQEIGQLCAQFSDAVMQDTRYFTATVQELDGVAESFLENLPRSTPETYKIVCAYPNLAHILSFCTVAQTRKQMYEIFNNRAYPANEIVLEQLVAKRHELANALGYQTFAHLDIADQMAQTPELVQAFLERLLVCGQKKALAEYAAYVQYLPKELVYEDGTIDAWNAMFARTAYIKNQYAFDQQEFAAYVALDNTVERMLGIYEDFFSLRMRIEDNQGAWHKDVKLISVRDRQSDALLGHIILDLKPREKKFGHFWTMPVIPALPHATPAVPAVAVVIGNFPERLPLDFGGAIGGIVTLFHELGHTFHELLSATKLASSAGMNVPLDFIEMPSNTLERFVWQPAILKRIGKHVHTGKEMPDELIAQALSLESALTGNFMLKLINGGLFALHLFGIAGEHTIATLNQKISDKVYPHIRHSDLDHSFASFGHLVDMYFTKYYGYAWSSVLAYDLFNKIQEGGFMDSEVGKRYRDQVIAAGGSAHPQDLLCDFIGRAPNEEAFFKAMGFEAE